MDDKWLSVDEIAEYLGAKRDTIYKWINRRQLPGHKVGRLWKFRKKEVDDWILKGKAESGKVNDQ
ncbi:MAG: helix-turn-helix domain-containing protein [Desulfobacula sp.]|jgi:excisionase family DNA binding protein|nr:helix-turn-helix domain-containing protein [Desulfobacula sp.]MBT6338839.1 helix-turn-helix domain-containing protein [Desulfobacula sp.]MBT7260001.1 helix-turn-helix domain-containing protein [Desulfobacula sp.]